MPLAAVRSTIPSPAELARRAEEIADLARERAVQTEQDRRVGEEIIAQIRRRDLFRVLQPKAYGGFEYGFDVFADLVTIIGRGCGSTSWVYGLGAVHRWLTACFPVEAQDEVWADDDSLMMGSYAPVGRAVPVEGGYRVSARWSFTSGCDNADWFILGGMIPRADDPSSALPGFMLAPKSDCTIIDNWDTMGLAGTGSKDVVGTDLFIPKHRAVTFADLLAGTHEGARLHQNALYRQSFMAVVPVCLVAPVIGMAEGALADFIASVKGRTTRGAVAGGNNRMAEFATIQSRVAEAAGCVDAARLLMLRDIEEALAIATRGEPIGLDIRLRNRRDHAFCTRLAVQAVDALFTAAGGQGIGRQNHVQRAWRDAHAAATHISMNWDAVSTMYGQYVFGLEPKGQY
jgi:alkylation response protein AidB-like acyl-CoA dehydrogenase